ncbi:MAG TPA: small ribosomal subunit Rsm22 family protein [Granulicella sp.]
MQLPLDLRSATTHLLEGVSRKSLGERSARISENYRAGGGSAVGVRDSEDALAYVIARLPATYAATRNVLSRLAERVPEFRPRTVLDLGAGPGTASWAMMDAWSSIETIVQVDQNRQMLELGKRLAASAAHAALREARQVVGDLARVAEAEAKADLVVLSYTLAELNTSQIIAVVRDAWRRCEGALVIVEPGTPSGYERILQARSLLLAEGAHVAAPCPHALPCPLTRPDWCHFTQRVARTRDHLLVKSASVPYEDERFSYLIVVRESLSLTAQQGRVLAAPQIDKARLAAKVCSVAGTVEQARIRKRDKELFARVKKLEWGDELPA